MGLGHAHGGAGPRAAREHGERGTGELGPGKEMALTCGSGRSVAGREGRAGDASALAGGPSEALALSAWRETGRALGPS